MKVISTYYAALAILLSLHGLTYGMDLMLADKTSEETALTHVRAPKDIILPWDIMKIILIEYFTALAQDNHSAIREGLGNLMEAFAISSYEKRSSILDLFVNIYDPSKITRLILACEIGRRPGVYTWMQHYPDLEKELSIAAAGTTPIISTLQSMSGGAFFLLLDKASHKIINTPNEKGYTPLMAAAALNNGDAIRALLKKGARIVAVDHDGFTALHRAVEGGNYAAAEALLSAGANPNVCTEQDGFTPLYIAIIIRNVPLVRLLLHHKADPNTKTKEGITPLMHVLYAVQQLKRETPVAYEEEVKKLIAISKHLLQHPTIKVNEPGRFGIHPLTKALECAVDEITEMLKAKGASMNKKGPHKCCRNNKFKNKTQKARIKH